MRRERHRYVHVFDRGLLGRVLGKEGSQYLHTARDAIELMIQAGHSRTTGRPYERGGPFLAWHDAHPLEKSICLMLGLYCTLTFGYTEKIEHSCILGYAERCLDACCYHSWSSCCSLNCSVIGMGNQQSYLFTNRGERNGEESK